MYTPQQKILKYIISYLYITLHHIAIDRYHGFIYILYMDYLLHDVPPRSSEDWESQCSINANEDYCFREISWDPFRPLDWADFWVLHGQTKLFLELWIWA